MDWTTILPTHYDPYGRFHPGRRMTLSNWSFFVLQPKIPQISIKGLEAKFRGRFCQVQQVNVKEKNYGQFPKVLIKLYKKF